MTDRRPSRDRALAHTAQADATDSSLVVVHSGPCSAGVSKIIFTVQNNGVIAQPFGLDFHTLTRTVAADGLVLALR